MPSEPQTTDEEYPIDLTTDANPWGGPTYSYRGAEIRCLPGSHVCVLHMPDHKLHGHSFGAPGTITPLIDLWLAGRKLPAYMRA